MYFDYLNSGVDIHPEQPGIVRLSGTAEVGLRADYGAAMRRGYIDMPLSRRGGGEYLALREQRRKDLEAILRTGLDGGNREKALDLICAICGETGWAAEHEGTFDDEAHPAIDIMATSTACLLAWTAREGGFESNVRTYILRQLRRRIFMPLIAHDDYACLRGDTPRALSMLCQAMAAALLLESDAARRTAFLRRAARAADAIIDAPDYLWPIGDMLSDWTEAAALWRLCREMTGPQLAARPLPRPQWLDALLIAHLGGGLFVDRRAGGLTEDINGADIYFLGNMAGDRAAETLGAFVYDKAPRELSSLSARLTLDPTMELISNRAAAPRFRHAAQDDGGLLSARGGGAYVTMHAGGRANAGGFCAYLDEAPVLFACGAGDVLIDGAPLTDACGQGDCDFGDRRADMSVDMTAALPDKAGVRFMQRTVMLDRDTGVTRTIDVAECERPAEIAYAFDTPLEPAVSPGGAVLGNCRFTWDGEMEPRVTRRAPAPGFPEGAYRIGLVYRLRAGSNIINFMLEPVQ